MPNIYDHLEAIKIRPGMYIGDNKISSLFIYLSGYIGCLSDHKVQENENPKFHGFHDWVAKYYGYPESTSGWVNMILDHSKNEEDALNNFFALVKEFRK